MRVLDQISIVVAAAVVRGCGGLVVGCERRWSPQKTRANITEKKLISRNAKKLISKSPCSN